MATGLLPAIGLLVVAIIAGEKDTFNFIWPLEITVVWTRWVCFLISVQLFLNKNMEFHCREN